MQHSYKLIYAYQQMLQPSVPQLELLYVHLLLGRPNNTKQTFTAERLTVWLKHVRANRGSDRIFVAKDVLQLAV